MKILQLTLKNFARVYSGLEKTEISIDFSNIDEFINLFVGANGSGKTSIRSCLHPFAYNSATGDGTQNSDLIIEGKSGEKIIVILRDDNNIYKIRHVYNRQKSGTILVKSFIEENGEELNPSGIVSTFKVIVQDKLGINESYLTLLSISNSVKGFVEFTASDRKNFTGKFFTQLEVYNQAYKSLSGSDRTLKSLLTNVSSKLSRYSSTSKEELRQRLIDTEKNIDNATSRKNQMMMSIGGLQNQLANYKDTISEYNEYQLKLTQLNSDLAILKSKRTTTKSFNEVDGELFNLVKKETELYKELSKVKGISATKLDMKSDKINQYNKTKDNLDKIGSLEAVDDCQGLLDYLNTEISDIESKYDTSFKYHMSKDDMIKSVVYLDELQRIMDNFILDVDDLSIIEPLYQKFLSDKAFVKTVQYQYDNAVDELKQYSALTGNMVNIPDIEIRHECSDENCPYKKFYERYKEAVANSVDENRLKIKTIEAKVSRYLNAVNAVRIFVMMDEHIQKYIKYLSNEDMFDVKTCVNTYVESRTIYDSDKTSSIIDTLEHLDKYKSLLESRDACIQKYEYVKNHREIVSSLTKECDSLSEDISKLEKEYDLLCIEINRLESEMSNLKDEQLQLSAQLDVIKAIDDMMVEITDVTKSIRDMDNAMIDINHIQGNLNTYNSNLQNVTQLLSDLNKEKSGLTVAISNLEELEREEIQLRTRYDLINNVKFALSPTTGLPVEFIEFYVKEEMIDKVNSLLDSVYYGKFRLIKEKVSINDKEFLIPYMKNHSEVEDICHASDGEKAILSLAISLVLIQMSQSNGNDFHYNILLLDEVDATLDSKSRAKFIELLEIFTKTIGAQQLFLISHNNMFDSYPVHVMLTSETQTFNYSNAHVTKLYTD